MSVLNLNHAVIASLLVIAAPIQAQGWQGPYVGVHLGGAVADFTNDAPAVPGPSGDTVGIMGGVQLGYNWQRGQSVLGAEADISFADISDRFAGGQFHEDLMTSLRLRAGVAQGETLFFGAVGVAWTEYDTDITGVGSSSDFEPGLMLGGGAERFIWGNIAGRVEAYYVDAPTEVQITGGTVSSGGSQNVIFRAGLSLHF